MFRDEYKSGLDFTSSDYIGYLSWKFEQKSKFNLNEFITLCDNNSGFDVYGVNCYEITFNPWTQGRMWILDFEEITKSVFKSVCREYIDPFELEFNESNICFCNYWIGNKKFWDSYMKFSIPFYEELMKRSREDKRILDNGYEHSIFPYFMERLFSTYLVLYDGAIKYKIFKGVKE